MTSAVVAFTFNGDAVVAADEFRLEEGLNVLYGLNGAGKTRILTGVRSALTGVASGVLVGLVVRIGSEVTPLSHSLAAALAQEGEYLHNRTNTYLGPAQPREREVPAKNVMPLIDRLISSAVGEGDDRLYDEVIRDRLFLFVPTGTEGALTWDVWPVADCDRPEARRLLNVVLEAERESDAAQFDSREDEDEAFTEFIDWLRTQVFFSSSESGISSRGAESGGGRRIRMAKETKLRPKPTEKS